MKFNGGVSVNVHCRKKVLKHLRIKAGPQRDQYVHDLVCRAKLLGRRESWEREHPGQPVPVNDFYSPEYETVDHENGDSLDNEPTNLVPVTNSENVRRMNERLARNKAEKKAKRVADAPF